MHKFILLVALAALVPACSSSDDDDNGGGGGGGGGGCSGDITGCSLGSLSDTQRTDMCNLVLSSIDSTQGARYECTSGPNQGAYLQISSKEACVAQSFPSGCSVKVSQLLDCYKAAKSNACTALSESGSCSFLGTATNCQ